MTGAGVLACGQPFAEAHAERKTMTTALSRVFMGISRWRTRSILQKTGFGNATYGHRSAREGRGHRAAPNWCLSADNWVQKWRDYEKQKSRSAASQSGSTDSSHSFWRAETAWREHRGGNQHLPELDVHVFVHAGNEGVGGGKKHCVHLHP